MKMKIDDNPATPPTGPATRRGGIVVIERTVFRVPLEA